VRRCPPRHAGGQGGPHKDPPTAISSPHKPSRAGPGVSTPYFKILKLNSKSQWCSAFFRSGCVHRSTDLDPRFLLVQGKAPLALSLPEAAAVQAVREFMNNNPAVIQNKARPPPPATARSSSNNPPHPTSRDHKGCLQGLSQDRGYPTPGRGERGVQPSS